MLDTNNPLHIPILQPNDHWVVREPSSFEALMVPAVCASNARLRAMAVDARQRAATLLVDPKTPYFQFEGYMSMPDYRTLPYSPGRSALGTLWQPGGFERAEARAEIIDAVVATQLQLGADIVFPPYFYVPHHEHPWLEVSRWCARETLAAHADQPVGVALCVDIDAIIDAAQRATIAAAYTDLAAALFWVQIVNYDERRADPRDVCTVLDFLGSLQATGVPVILSHTGRTGLAAIAGGARGYACGPHGLEHHPRSFFREMMGTRAVNSYYMRECYCDLGVRQAQACLALGVGEAHARCDCPACNHDTDIGLMVSRRLTLHAMFCRFAEIRDLASVDDARRADHLIARFSGALAKTAGLSAALQRQGRAAIRDGDVHYLEVLREALGGQEATIPS